MITGLPWEARLVKTTATASSKPQLHTEDTILALQARVTAVGLIWEVATEAGEAASSEEVEDTVVMEEEEGLVVVEEGLTAVGVGEVLMGVEVGEVAMEEAEKATETETLAEEGMVPTVFNQKTKSTSLVCQEI